MSDDGNNDGPAEVVDAEVVDDEPGTELDLYDPAVLDVEPGTEVDPYTYGLDQAGPTVTVLDVEDVDQTIDAEISEDIERALLGPQVTSDSAAASRGGSPTVYGPGGKGMGGGKLSRKERKRRGLGGGGGGFTLFGFTVNVSPRLNIASGNSASVFGGRGGRSERKAKAAKLTRGGKNGSKRAMQRKIVRSRWLNNALGGKR